MTAETLATRVLAGAQRLKREYDDVQGVATTDTLRRARALTVLAVPLHAALGWWFGHYQAPHGEVNLQAWADALVWLQYGVSGALLVCGLLAHILQQSGQRVPGFTLGVAKGFQLRHYGLDFVDRPGLIVVPGTRLKVDLDHNQRGDDHKDSQKEH